MKIDAGQNQYEITLSKDGKEAKFNWNVKRKSGWEDFCFVPIPLSIIKDIIKGFQELERKGD